MCSRRSAGSSRATTAGSTGTARAVTARTTSCRCSRLRRSGGRLGLGTWQSIVLVDTNREKDERGVVLSFVPG
jgi:thiamine phosphate synthase YjbQ (UPF0047 family)